MKRFAGEIHIAPMLPPTDVPGAATTTTDPLRLSLYDSLTVVYLSDAGTAGQDATVSLPPPPTPAPTPELRQTPTGQTPSTSRQNRSATPLTTERVTRTAAPVFVPVLTPVGCISVTDVT